MNLASSYYPFFLVNFLFLFCPIVALYFRSSLILPYNNWKPLTVNGQLHANENKISMIKKTAMK